ncbi:MAG: pantetheine-phosphate adenylyltransferase [Rhodothermales bacterium]
MIGTDHAHRLALFPGTFDPFTLGHLDVLKRALSVFDRIDVTVAVNTAKTPILSLEERCELILATVSDMHGVSVTAFDGLLVDHARATGAAAIVRGLRQVNDLDYEQRMAFANRRMFPELETVFFKPSEQYALISGSLVREIYRWGGDITPFVPPPIAEALLSRRAATD